MLRSVESDDELRFLLEGQELSAELNGRPYELYATSLERFKLAIGPVYFTFKSDEAGSITGVTVEQPGETTEAARIR